MSKYFEIVNAVKGESKSLLYYVKYAALCMLEPLYKLLFTLFPRKDEPRQHFLSICAIFKNEAAGMREWIAYHQLQGVDHFYLYNNNSTDNFMEVLQPYIDEGTVTLTEWPQVPGQLPMYHHWYEHYRKETNWCAFIDLDEFFVPYHDDTFAQWLQRHEKYPLLLVNWKMFGSSGRLEHDDNLLVTEQYFNCWEKLSDKGKIIYNTSCDIAFFKLDMMHYFMVRYRGLKIPPMNTFGHFVLWNIHRGSCRGTDIQLNHYWSKAYGNYEKKHQRGSAVYGKSWKTFDKFLEYEHNNTSSDFKIYRFLTQLKLKLSGRYPQQES